MVDHPKPDPCHDISLIERHFVFPQPRPDFNPVTAPQAELKEYGIIPRPDAERQPLLYKNWLRIFGGPVKFVPVRLEEMQANWQLNPATTRARSLAIGGATRFQKSRNWSGAFIVPTHDTMVTVVAGQWTLPTLKIPPPEQRATDDKPYTCSTWVGLDGQRLYLNSTLPQVGVTQTLTVVPSANPEPPARAFFQWWDGPSGGSYLTFDKFQVKAGDVIIGVIWAVTPTSVIVYLRNNTTGAQLVRAGLNAPSRSPTITITGATAEWILERPTEFGGTELRPFPDYGTTAFDWCWAGTAHDPGTPTSAHDLLTARLIRMYDTLYQPTRAAFISSSSRIGEAGVRLDYGSFKD